MRKIAILLIALTVINVGFLSGCTDQQTPNSQENQNNQDQGLIMHWAFDENSGNNIQDSISGYSGTLSGAEWISGVSGSALKCIDTDIVSGISASCDDSITTAFTITAWVSWNGANSVNRSSYIFDARTDATSGFIFMIERDGNITLNVLKPDTQSQSFKSTTTIPTNTWTHIAVVFNYTARTARLYINGEEVDVYSVTDLYYNTSLSPSIGNNRWAPGDHQWAPLNGKLDELCIYNQALSPENIHTQYELYANQIPSSVTEGLISCWHFDEERGSTANDTSGYENHGTINGANWVPGVSNSSLEIKGTNIVQFIPSSFDDPIDTAFTITAWIYWYGPTGLPTQDSYIFDARNDDTAGFILYLKANGTVEFFLLKPDSTLQLIRSNSTIQPNIGWTHIAGVFDQTIQTLRLYINGEEDTASPVAAPSPYYHTTMTAAIGNNRWAPVDHQWAPLNGLVDELRIYNRGLNQSEIVHLYETK
ncbi:MAG: LamG domain-containing protein [Euryarchaeota archaeon]|nr:LamG domain-containing protein [Euryarchaeota archaeon]